MKSAAKISLAVLGILLLGAIIFYKERMLFLDSCFMVFNILNEHHLMIQQNRYGSFITQLVPFLGDRLHLSLKTILICYSISFNLFYFIVAGLLVFRLKQYALAILMALYYTLFVSDTYFWTNNEVHQGIAWMFLFFGVVLQERIRPVKPAVFILLFLLLGFLSIFSHFVVMIPFAYLWVFFWLDKERKPLANKKYVWCSTLLLGLVAIKFILGMHGWYDGEKLQNVTHTTLPTVLHVFSSAHAQSILPMFISNYWLSLLLFITSIVILIIQKKYKALGLTLFFSLTYFILLCLTFDGFGKDQLFYMESEWMGLSIIIAAPVVFYLLPKLRNMQVVGIVSAIFIVRLFYIGLSVPTFVNRVAYIESVEVQMKKKNISKLILVENPEADKVLLMNWGVPVESLCNSIMNGDNPPINFAMVPENEAPRSAPISKNDIVVCFGACNYKKLNTRYFTIDTSSTYKVMSYGELYDKK